MLRAKKPELVKLSKPKLLISGAPNVGKTFFAMDFPNAYYIDTEGSATLPDYRKLLVEKNIDYMGKEDGSQNFLTVIEQFRDLATTQHGYKTLILDTFSHLYNLEASQAEERVGNDFGKDRKEANRPTRQLMRWFEKIDMTTIFICHTKEKWKNIDGKLVNLGSTFDGYEKFEYIFNLWIEFQKEPNSEKRWFIVKKSKFKQFEEGVRYPLEYSKFAELYGKEIIEKDASPLNMATEDQIAKLTKLIEVVKLDEGIIQKWKDIADADTWNEFTFDQMKKCLDYLEEKLSGLSNGKKPDESKEIKEIVKGAKK